MKKLVLALLVTASLPSIADAKKKQLTSLELQQLQTREFEVPKDTAFAAVMTVLQDSGYRIGSADRDTGLITGVASTNTKMTWLPFVGFGQSKKTPVVSAYIEDRGPAVARVRLSFVMTKDSANKFGGTANETPITDANVYQDAFERISKEVFVRQAMRNGPSVTAPGGDGAAPAVAPVATATPQQPTAVTTPSIN